MKIWLSKEQLFSPSSSLTEALISEPPLMTEDIFKSLPLSQDNVIQPIITFISVIGM